MVSHSYCPFPGNALCWPVLLLQPGFTPRIKKVRVSSSFPLTGLFLHQTCTTRSFPFPIFFFFLLCPQENSSNQLSSPGKNYRGHMLLDNQAEQPKKPLSHPSAGTDWMLCSQQLQHSPSDLWVLPAKISAQTNRVVERFVH